MLVWMFIVTFALFLINRGRSYYTAPAYVMLLAAGCVWFESWLTTRAEKTCWVGSGILWFMGSSLMGLPIAFAPMNLLRAAIFGDPMIPTHMMFRPIPTWAFVLSLLFPLTIAFAELPTYFGYAMPRIAAQMKNGWLAWLIASFFLAAQHMFLPLILDGGFMMWRLSMYLPFARFAVLMFKLRPTLLPYFVIVHALMDVSAVMVYMMI